MKIFTTSVSADWNEGTIKEFATLEELMAFIKESGHSVIIDANPGMYFCDDSMDDVCDAVATVYDDYME